MIRLVSVNLSRGEGPSGINKRPVTSAFIHELGLAGDHIADREHHGGPDQAVYVYSAEDYDWWMEELGQPLAAGTFGENLTFSSFGPEPVRIGDRFRIGSVWLEVSAPRIPCATLAVHMNDPGFVKRFRQVGRPGFYARVLQPGLVQAPQAVEKVAAPSHHPTLVEVFALWYEKAPQPARLRWALGAPLAERARRVFAERLRNLEGT